MKPNDWVCALGLAALAGAGWVGLAGAWRWVLVGGALLAAWGWQAWRRRQDRQTVVELGGLRWDRHAFCQGWLITGATGAGKNRSGIHQILHQLFRRQPGFGLLCIDDKGVIFETLQAMARHYGREDDLILLQARGQDTPKDWQPVHRLNLAGDPAMAPATCAQCAVDAAVVLGNRHEQSFFRQAAQILIGTGLQVLPPLGYDVTLENVHGLLTHTGDLQKSVAELRNRPGATEWTRQLQEFLDQPPEQRSGIQATVSNYLHYYTTPEMAEVFSRDSTFSLADLDQGKLICLALPHRFHTERRYIGIFLKQLFHLHVLRRFDLPQAERERLNLLVLLADEAQHFVTASQDGLSDHALVDVIREAGAAFIAATQSTTSLVPPLGADQAKVLTLNLRNRIIFTAADEADAQASADFLGKRRVRQRSWTYSGGRRSETLTEVEAHRVQPHELRQLRKHQGIVVHADLGFRKCVLAPLEPDGSVSRWFRRFRPGYWGATK